MLEKKKWRQSHDSYDQVIKDCKEDLGKPDISGEEALKHILGDVEHYSHSEYVIYKYETTTQRTLIQRFNYLWVMPLFILSIPLQWLVKGEIGVSRNGKIGQVIDYLVKFDR